jgi:predicted dinucleotide-binding enzyme
MKIGIIGSGEVGQALGKGFADLGHEVKIGSREPGSGKLQAWIKKTGGKTSAGTFEETARFGEVIVVATHGMSSEEALKSAGESNFSGKVVIDVTNPLDLSGGMPPKLALGFSTSLGERIQAALPKSHVVKTLNIVNNRKMVNPRFEDGEPDMLLCGNDAEAKKKVEKILRDFGWRNVTDLGGIEQARIMEPMVILWVLYGARNNVWTHAFKMLRK